jgi:hypothetical protein
MDATLDPPRENARARKRRYIRGWLWWLRSTGTCCLCGAPHRPGAGLAFHHRGQKRFKLSHAGRFSRGAVRRELLKCSICCWPCHCAVHAGTVDGSALAPVAVPDLTAEPPTIETRS